MAKICGFLWSMVIVFGIVISAKAAPIYFNDFQGTPDMTGWNYTNLTTDNNGETVVGVFNNNETVNFTLSSLPAGDYSAGFDFFVLNSWDGNGDHCCGPDYFTFRINGVDFVRATFMLAPYLSTTQGYTPSTPLGGNAPNGPGGSGNTGVNILDITSPIGTSVPNTRYTFDFPFTHPGGDLVLSFIGGVTQPGQIWSPYWGGNNYYDEPWAIDNVLITSTAPTPVPEPTSLLLLGSGLLGLAGTRKIRKRKTVSE